MFKNEDILEFLTRIIKNSNSQNIKDSKGSIGKFIEYLKLTTMCDENTLKAIENVFECFEELVVIYEKTGICDLKSIFNKKINANTKSSVSEEIEEDKTEKSLASSKKRTFIKRYQKKHYDRYVPTIIDYTSYGSSCGAGKSYGSMC